MQNDLASGQTLATHAKRARVRAAYPPLQRLTVPTVDTHQAAFYLNRKASTLFAWSAYETGPLRPIRVNGRLAWKVAEIATLLDVALEAA